MQKNKVIINTKINEVFAKTSVTYNIINISSYPIELAINFLKNVEDIIFSSFYAKIGNSTIMHSKVIKTEKAEEKYSDAISSGNLAISSNIDESDKNKIVVNIGNIPPKEELIFIIEYIQFLESSDNKYEHELFRSLPQINSKYIDTLKNEIEGILEINTKCIIKNIKKNFLSENFKLKEEEINENKFFIKYEYINLEIEEPKVGSITYLSNNENLKTLYIPSSKIYFEFESNNSILFLQNNPKNKNEQSYILNYKLIQNTKKDNSNDEDIKLSPALFIFLIDQSGSMAGSRIKIASKALLLFLQSLPAGSFYQIIGFGSSYEFYDEIPKEYNQKNIEKSIKIVEALKGDMGGTNIYNPLKLIYNSKNYDNIYLPKNIFLLTDGEINSKEETLNLIEKNSNEFSVFSFGIGNEFDEDLIKNAGVLGKGNYSFCRNINGLNQVIISNLNNICVSYIHDFKINSSLDENNLYKINNATKIIKENKIYFYGYINACSEEEKSNKKKSNFTVKYYQNKEEFTENFELVPIILPQGDELSKLIIYNHILKNDKLSDEEKIKLALKYQLLIKGTSLFGEIELNEKNTSQQMVKIEIEQDNKKTQLFSEIDKKIDIQNDKIDDLEKKVNELTNEAKEKLKNRDREAAKNILKKKKVIMKEIRDLEGSLGLLEQQKMMLENASMMKNIFEKIKNTNQAITCAQGDMKLEDFDSMKEDFESMKSNEINEFFQNKEEEDDIEEDLNDLEENMNNNEICECQMEKNDKINIDKEVDFLDEEESSKKEENKEDSQKKEEEIIKLDLNNKEDVMKIINSQNFLEGYWDINGKTMNIKNKYETEFNKLKELKILNNNDIIAMTIIVIYFIYKNYKEIIDELIMIIKKGKLYIKDKTGDSYDNIIKIFEI